ncbi:acyl-CoA dehydrogenase/oxidase [Choanephora cucurbitarum]|nr:acyl-CoA dehydrogenase/oxidase [Choanephora cucurbitarum]
MKAVHFPTHLKPLEPHSSALLALEREKASFDSNELMLHLYGKDYLAKRDRILAIMQSDPILSDKSHRYYQGRHARFKQSLAAAQRMVILSKKHRWTDEEFGMAEYLFDEPSPFRLHRSMFMPTILNQGTEEQKRIFLEPARRYEIIGCYAQTELGHGSNVRGLETTATYHPETETFEINSPTLTSSKWWIGGLGVAANHAVVMARLISDGKDYGPHPFVVQIRSLEDHAPLKGITVGDIGPKFGFNTVDNGFILFDHVHVPHHAMLARYSSVDKKTGKYITPPNSKLAYGTMVYVRANIVLESCQVLARAATVATRYSAVRMQGSDTDQPKTWPGADNATKTIETPVLDYTMQQYRLLPIIAQAYACHFTGQEMHRMYHENQAKMAAGDFSYLADLHASSSGLKSLTTTMAVAAIEDCRRACGGHGYSLFSGLGQFYQDYLPKATWEGDNYLLTQQTTRYLLKTFRSIQSNKGAKSSNFTSDYLADYLAAPHARCTDLQVDSALTQNPDWILAAFRHRAAFLIDKLAYALDQDGRTWNDCLVEIYRVSRSHCQLMMVYHFFKTAFQPSSASSPTQATLKRMAILFGLFTMEQDISDFLISGYFSSDQAWSIKQSVVPLLKLLRPDAVALVDAFGLPDYLLFSALGESQGQVYERMTEMAEKEPLNSGQAMELYQQFIRPLTHQNQGLSRGDARL